MFRGLPLLLHHHHLLLLDLLLLPERSIEIVSRKTMQWAAVLEYYFSERLIEIDRAKRTQCVTVFSFPLSSSYKRLSSYNCLSSL